MAEDTSLALHVCCAPCLAAARETLRHAATEGFPEVARIIFYNPNIHPLLEFRRRIKALQVYLERDPVSAEIDTTYGLRAFLEQVAGGGQPSRDRRERCRQCYKLRLGRVARMTAEQGYAYFSTTLLASREQDRDLVAEAGRQAGREAGVRFVEADLRKFLPDEKMMRGIYKQQYCGCIFSEEERYRNTAKHLYQPGGGNPPEGVEKP